jgi:hypothetical protein
MARLFWPAKQLETEFCGYALHDRYNLHFTPDQATVEPGLLSDPHSEQVARSVLLEDDARRPPAFSFISRSLPPGARGPSKAPGRAVGAK